jgi:hypothetical protein
VPDGRRVLAFLTDADLPAARIAHDSVRLIECVDAAREIRAILAESEFVPIGGGFTAAHSSALEPCGGADWLAAGDASMSFDPVSSQGLLHACFTGLAAAEAADAWIAGDDDAVPRYLQLMNSIQQSYRRRFHGSGDCGVEGRAPCHARRPAALLDVGDHDGADAAGGFPPGATGRNRLRSRGRGVRRTPASASSLPALVRQGNSQIHCDTINNPLLTR